MNRIRKLSIQWHHFLASLAALVLLASCLAQAQMVGDAGSYKPQPDRQDLVWAGAATYKAFSSSRPEDLITLGIVMQYQKLHPNASSQQLQSVSIAVQDGFQKLREESNGHIDWSNMDMLPEMLTGVGAIAAEGSPYIEAVSSFSKALGGMVEDAMKPMVQQSAQSQYSNTLSNAQIAALTKTIIDGKILASASPSLQKYMQTYSETHFQIGINDSPSEILKKAPGYRQVTMLKEILSATGRQMTKSEAKALAKNLLGKLNEDKKQIVAQFKADLNEQNQKQIETKKQEQQQAIRERADEQAQYATTQLAGFVLGRVNPELGKDVSIASDAYFSLKSSLSLFQLTQAAGVAQLTNSLILSSNLLSLGLGIANALSQQKSPDQMILEALAKISKQIEDLRKEMNQRFDAVDFKLDQLLERTTSFSIDLATGQENDFYETQKTLASLKRQIDQVQSGLVSVDYHLLEIQKQIAESKNDLLWEDYQGAFEPCRQLDNYDTGISSSMLYDYWKCLDDLSTQGKIFAMTYQDVEPNFSDDLLVVSDFSLTSVFERLVRAHDVLFPSNLDISARLPNAAAWLQVSHDYVAQAIQHDDLIKFAGDHLRLDIPTAHLLETGERVENTSQILLSIFGNGSQPGSLRIPGVLNDIAEHYTSLIYRVFANAKSDLKYFSTVNGIPVDVFSQTISKKLNSAAAGIVLPPTLPDCGGKTNGALPLNFAKILPHRLLEAALLSQKDEFGKRLPVSVCLNSIHFGPVQKTNQFSQNYGSYTDYKEWDNPPRPNGMPDATGHILKIVKPISWSCIGYHQPLVVDISLLANGEPAYTYEFTSKENYNSYDQCSTSDPHASAKQRTVQHNSPQQVFQANWSAGRRYAFKFASHAKLLSNSKLPGVATVNNVIRIGFEQQAEAADRQIEHDLGGKKSSILLERLQEQIDELRAYTQLALPISYLSDGVLRQYFTSRQYQLFGPDQLKIGYVDARAAQSSSAPQLEALQTQALVRLRKFIQAFVADIAKGPQIPPEIAHQIRQLEVLKKAQERARYKNLGIDQVIEQIQSFARASAG